MEDKIAHDVNKHKRSTDIRLKEVFPFNRIGLSEAVLAGLHGAGYYWPTVIQATAISMALKGANITVQSKSGTGKTLIYAVVALQKYDRLLNNVQTLIIVPTRELACQVEEILNCIGKHCSKFKAVMVIGGTNQADDRQRLEGARAVIGTPGRLVHLLNSKKLNPSKLKLLVVDEIDKLLSESFRDDLRKILDSAPVGCHFISCSATFPDKLDEDILKFASSAIFISNIEGTSLLVGIRQFVLELPAEINKMLEIRSKLAAVEKVFKSITFRQCVIFTNSQLRADTYCNYLKKDGWSCELLSGAQDQKTRLENFRKLRSFDTRIMVTTDLLARGVDSDHINLVINLEMPEDISTYLHRIGRAGRFGTQGIAVNILTQNERIRFQHLISGFDSEMSVYVMPIENVHQHDFWNFESYKFPIFEKLIKADLEDSSEQKPNINTETYPILSEQLLPNCKNAENIQKQEHTIPHLNVDEPNGSNTHSTVSNTVDDASSLIHDPGTMSIELDNFPTEECEIEDCEYCQVEDETEVPFWANYTYEELTEALKWLETLKNILNEAPMPPIDSLLKKYQQTDCIGPENKPDDDLSAKSLDTATTNCDADDSEIIMSSETTKEMQQAWDRKFQVLSQRSSGKKLLSHKVDDAEEQEREISAYSLWVRKYDDHLKSSHFGQEQMSLLGDTLLARAFCGIFANEIRAAIDNYTKEKCLSESTKTPVQDENVVKESEKVVNAVENQSEPASLYNSEAECSSKDSSNTSIAVEPPTESSTTGGKEAIHYPSLVEPVDQHQAAQHIAQQLVNASDEEEQHVHNSASEASGSWSASSLARVANSSGFDEGWSSVSSGIETSQEANIDGTIYDSSSDPTFIPPSGSTLILSLLDDSETLNESSVCTDDLTLENDTSVNSENVQEAYDRWYALYETQMRWLREYVEMANRRVL